MGWTIIALLLTLMRMARVLPAGLNICHLATSERLSAPSRGSQRDKNFLLLFFKKEVLPCEPTDLEIGPVAVGLSAVGVAYTIVRGTRPNLAYRLLANELAGLA